MNIAPHDYVPPQAQQIGTLPPAIITFLDGTDLLAKTHALRLSTVDAANWPHASLLSAGDMVAMPSAPMTGTTTMSRMSAFTA